MASRLLACLTLIAGGALSAPVTAQQVVVVNCESVAGRQQYCEVETRYGVRLVEEFSRNQCREGDTWGYDDGRIWVRGGCRAAFELGTGGGGRDDRRARAYDEGQRDARYDERIDGQRYDDGRNTRYLDAATFVCESKDNRRRYCAADAVTSGGRVALARNISRAPCIEGTSWGQDRRGVWVDQGCRAEFAVETRREFERRGGSPAYAGRRDIVHCESEDFRRQTCGVGSGRSAIISRQTSKADCVEGRTWGYDGRDLWVDRGCGGDFEVVR